jgi:aarF domain-containing kinase
MVSGWSRSIEMVKLAAKLGTSEAGRWILRALSQDPKTTDLRVRLKQAEELVGSLGNLKGALMKAGQLLALEARHYLPDEVLQVLERLEAGATPLSAIEIESLLKKALGEKAKDFTGLSSKPLGSASMGQVHEAFLGMRRVAVKVQYPGVRQSIDQDLQSLRGLVRSLMVLFNKRGIDEDHFFDHIRQTLIRETDYLHEGACMRSIQEFASQEPHLLVPTFFEDYSCETVLTMDYLEGSRLSHLIREHMLQPEDKEFYGDLFLHLYCQEFCTWGLVQTDPNLGNFLIQLKERKLALLDFGATEVYSLVFRKKYAQLVFASLEGRRSQVVDMIFELDLLHKEETPEAIEVMVRLIKESLEPFKSRAFDFTGKDYPHLMRELSRDLIRKVKKSGPPASILFLHRKLSGIYHILGRLGSKKDLQPFLEPFSKLNSASSAESGSQGL